MKSVLQQKRFDFSYNGVPFSEIPCSIMETQEENFSLSGKELKEQGFTVRIDQKRSSKIFFYRYE